MIDYSNNVNLHPLRKYSGQQNNRMIYWPPARSNKGGGGSFDETMTSSPPHLHHLTIMMIVIVLNLVITMTITWSPSPNLPADVPTPCSGSKNVQGPELIFLEPFKTSCCVEGLYSFMQNHRIWKNAVLHLVIINIAKGASDPRVENFCESNILNCYV